MLYQIRLQYGFMIEANSPDDAHQKAVCSLREAPESHISRVERANTPRKRSIVKRIFTGK